MQGSRWQGRSRRGQHLRSPLVYQPWLEPFNMSTRSTKLLIKRRQKKKKKTTEDFGEEDMGKNH
jgi:hypothetical protein